MVVYESNAVLISLLLTSDDEPDASANRISILALSVYDHTTNCVCNTELHVSVCRYKLLHRDPLALSPGLIANSVVSSFGLCTRDSFAPEDSFGTAG
jgi:hypothetical protein